MILLLPLLAAFACLIASVFAMRHAEQRRPFSPWPSDAERFRRHAVTIELALWAIAFLLVWIGLR